MILELTLEIKKDKYLKNHILFNLSSDHKQTCNPDPSHVSSCHPVRFTQCKQIVDIILDVCCCYSQRYKSWSLTGPGPGIGGFHNVI